MSDLISRQDAIEIVNKYDKSHMILKGKPMLGAASIVIELKDLPSVQPEVLAHGEGESMSDGIMLMIGDDGIAREYSDEFDVVIHCESEEEREKVIEIINSMPLPESWKGEEMINDEFIKNTYRSALKKYGYLHQQMKCIEEMIELTKAICKHWIFLEDKDFMDDYIPDIREEMADVEIMLDQMKIMFGDVSEIKEKKIHRLFHRLQKEEDDDSKGAD